MIWLRSALFAVLFYPGTLLFVLAGIAASPFGDRPTRAVVHGWSRFHRLLTRHLIGIRERIEGTLPAAPCLIAIKHQSMYETVATLRLFDTPVVVMKRQLTDIPLFGWLTRRYGVIGVDREAGAAALRNLVTEGRAAVDSGRPIVIFPEGTRVKVGEQPELRPGFAALYRAVGLPVVPVAVDAGRLWTKGVRKYPGTVTWRFGGIIPPGEPRRTVEAAVHAAINALDRPAS